MAEDKDLNRDRMNDDSGSHPIGTGVGAAGGAVAGAAAGAVGGPAGMIVGGVVGAVVGGLAGRAAAEAIDPAQEEAHWRDNYNREPYYEQGRSFDDYAPAYRLGVTGRTRHENWDSAEPQLRNEWESTRGSSNLDWDRARPASRAAWERTDKTLRERYLRETDVGLVSMGGRSDVGSPDQGISADDFARDTNTRSGTSSGVTGMGHPNDLGMQQSQGMRHTQNMGQTPDMAYSQDRGTTGAGMGMNTGGGAAAAVGSMQSAGNTSGDHDDVIDVLQDLAECSLDGEYGFRSCAEHAKREDLKSMFLQRADDCRRAVQELNEQIRACGGKVEEHGSAMGAMHRGWVAVKSAMTTYDDKAILEEAERGEDNAKARYMKALRAPLPPQVKLVVERQMQGLQRNHDQVKMLRDQLRAQS